MTRIELREIIGSEGEQHLSLYVDYSSDMTTQLLRLLLQTRETLSSSMDFDEIESLLAPIIPEFMMAKEAYEGSHSLAIYRRNGFIKIIGLPEPHGNFHVLSQSFHVKPLLTWLQDRSEGTLVFCDRNRVRLFCVGSHEVTSIFELPVQLKSPTNPSGSTSEKLAGHETLHHWMKLVFENKKLSLPDPVYIYGDHLVAETCEESIRMLKRRRVSGVRTESDPNLGEALHWSITRIRKQDRKARLIQRNRFLSPSRNEYVSVDWNEILGAIKDQRLISIMIANDVRIFGKIHEPSNRIELTIQQTDHEDDDILDDISQLAIKNGVTPSFFDSSRLPPQKRKLIRAIIKRDNTESKQISGDPLSA